MVDGIPVLSLTCLIPFKAKAWLDLKPLGIRGTDKKKMTEMLYQCYGLKDNT